MKQKDMYTLEELFDGLKISLSKLSKIADINEGTLIRIQKGTYSVRKTTINKILDAFSEIYGIELSAENVTGFKVEDKKALAQQHAMPSTEQEPIQPIGETPIVATSKKKASQNRATVEKKQGESPMHEDLPPGTIKLWDFIQKYNLPHSSVGRWVEKGLKGETIETTTRTRTNGAIQHYFTPEQAEKAVEILKRHGKLMS